MTHWIPNRATKRRNGAQGRLGLPLASVPGDERQSENGILESDIQPAVHRLLLLHPAVAWAERINVGAGRLADEDGNIGRFIRFAFKGCADIIGQLKDGRFLAVECKTATGTLRVEQAAFLAKVNKFGGVAFIARSPDDVITHLERRV